MWQMFRIFATYPQDERNLQAYYSNNAFSLFNGYKKTLTDNRRMQRRQGESRWRSKTVSAHRRPNYRWQESNIKLTHKPQFESEIQ
jgi:hypothetical protein